MKFKDYKYERFDVEKVKLLFKTCKETMLSASDYATFKKAFDAYVDCFSELETMNAIMYVRNTINTEDVFYEKERAFWDENLPVIQEDMNALYEVTIHSPFVEELKKEVDATYFMGIDNALKSFNAKIISDLQEENQLTGAYQKLIASAQITFDNETYTLASIGAKMVDKDRDVRKKSMQAYWGWMEEHEDKLDELFDKLVKVRDRMAKKLGFDNYIELGYLQMNRYDYDQNDVSNYRKQVLKDVVPLAMRLFERQKDRLGYDRLASYDIAYEFESGNPTPKHSMDELVKRANQMYHELSKETGVFFDFMVEHDLLDLEAKKGKAGGGYCIGIPNYNSPFIFSNANGTSGDVDTLTHEAGHAFQMYSSMGIRPIESQSPTYESAEIHSMSMEFFTWPWMKLFFEEDVEKYYYLHLGSAVKFIPYGILVDHFQHIVYEHPEMTPAQRKEAWRKLEKEYCPWKTYEDIPFLDKGTWWFRQSHIFERPFYYVDYTLAQVCALQFWLRIQNNDDKAFDDYQKICKVGGTLPFRKIVQLANLKVPFNDGCLEDVMKEIETYLESIDDKRL